MRRSSRNLPNVTPSSITTPSNEPVAPQVPTPAITTTTTKRSVTKPPPAIYTPCDLKAMIDYLRDRASEAGDGGNFPNNVFSDCAKHLNELGCEAGGPKTMSSVKTKFQRFFKREMRVILMIQGNSGWPTWTDDGGANMPAIIPNEPKDNLSLSWDDFVIKHPSAVPYRNAGWAYLDQMHQIMPTAIATGQNVTRAAKQSARQVPDDTQEGSGTDSEFEGDEDTESGQQLNKLGDNQDQINSVAFSSHDTHSDTNNNIIEPSPTTFRERANVIGAFNNTTRPPISISTKRKAPDTPFTPKTDTKRQMLPSNNPYRAPNGPQAIAEMTGAVREWTSTALRLFEKRPAFPNSPERKAQAIARCQEIEYRLNDQELMTLINVFERDSAKATAYLAINREGVRDTWVDDTISNEVDRQLGNAFSS